LLVQDMQTLGSITAATISTNIAFILSVRYQYLSVCTLCRDREV
jgi:hypothetical protein